MAALSILDLVRVTEAIDARGVLDNAREKRSPVKSAPKILLRSARVINTCLPRRSQGANRRMRLRHRAERRCG